MERLGYLAALTVEDVFPLGLDWQCRPVNLEEGDERHCLTSLHEELVAFRKQAAAAASAASTSSDQEEEHGASSTSSHVAESAPHIAHLRYLFRTLQDALPHWLAQRAQRAWLGVDQVADDVGLARAGDEMARAVQRSEQRLDPAVQAANQQLASSLDEEAVAAEALLEHGGALDSQRSTQRSMHRSSSASSVGSAPAGHRGAFFTDKVKARRAAGAGVDARTDAVLLFFYVYVCYCRWS